MCSPTWETHIPCDMFFPAQETHIASYMCSPTWETPIPSDMWYELMWCFTRFYQLNKCRCRCVPLPGKHISLVICFFLPRKHISLVICVPLLWKHVSLVICVPYSQSLSQFWITNVMRNFSPRDWKFCFVVSYSWSNHLFCDLHLILLPLAFNPTSLHASTKVSLRCYHVWQLLLTWIELFILIVICLPLPAPPGNTGCLLSLLLRLLKIFLRTLDWRRWILAGIFNEIRFTLFTWCPLASFVIIFPICFDLDNFLYPEFPTDQENNHTGSKKDTK